MRSAGLLLSVVAPGPIFLRGELALRPATRPLEARQGPGICPGACKPWGAGALSVGPKLVAFRFRGAPSGIQLGRLLSATFL